MVDALDTTSAERETVRQSARAYAFDWYLAALLAPRHASDDLLAFAAYAGESARIGLTVSDPALGAIKLQWWRDAIEGGPRGTRTGSPVTDALLAAAARLGIPSGLLTAQLDGRDRELDANSIPNEEAFKTYLDETWGSAFRLAAVALGGRKSDELLALCASAAGAYGRARIALDLPRYLAHGRIPLPASRLAGTDFAALPPDDSRAAAQAQIAMLADEARASLSDARRALRDLPRAARTAFVPLALVEPYFRALQAPSGDPARDIVDISPLARVARLWLAKTRGKV